MLGLTNIFHFAPFYSFAVVSVKCVFVFIQATSLFCGEGDGDRDEYEDPDDLDE